MRTYLALMASLLALAAPSAASADCAAPSSCTCATNALVQAEVIDAPPSGPATVMVTAIVAGQASVEVDDTVLANTSLPVGDTVLLDDRGDGDLSQLGYLDSTGGLVTECVNKSFSSVEEYGVYVAGGRCLADRRAAQNAPCDDTGGVLCATQARPIPGSGGVEWFAALGLAVAWLRRSGRSDASAGRSWRT